MRLAAAALLVLGACGARAARPTLLAPGVDEREPAAAPDLSSFEGWTAMSPPVRFAPVAAGPTLQALILGRDIVDDRELKLVVARLGGQVLATAPVAHVRVGGASRREVLAALSRWPLGGQRAGLRVDVSVFELSPPRRFVVKTLVVDVERGDPRIVLDRLVESGDDASDRRATLAARDLDGDGAAEILVDERETGARKRTLVYRRGKAGVYETRDPSLFDE